MSEDLQGGLELVIRKLKRLRDDAEELLAADTGKVLYLSGAICKRWTDLLRELENTRISQSVSEKIETFRPVPDRSFRPGADVARTAQWVESVHLVRSQCEDILDLLRIRFERRSRIANVSDPKILVQISNNQYAALEAHLGSYQTWVERTIGSQEEKKEIGQLAREIIDLVREGPKEQAKLRSKIRRLMDISLEAFLRLLPLIVQRMAEAGG